MTESSKPRELSEKDKKAMGQFITTCFNLNDPVESFQAHWSKYGFEVACDYLRTEELDAALARIKLLEEVCAELMKSMDVAKLYLESCGYRKLEKWEPERQMLEDFERALESAREKIGGGK